MPRLGDLIDQLRGALEPAPAPPEAPLDPRSRRVLVVYLFSGLGDGILLAPVLRALEAAGVALPIGVVTRPAPAAALSHLDLPLRLYVVPEGSVPTKDARRGGYELGIDLTLRADADGRGWLSGTAAKLGFLAPGEQPKDAGLSRGRLDRRWRTDRHFSASLAEPLLDLGITGPRYDVRWVISPAEHRRAAEISGPSRRPRVLLVPGSRSQEKRWPPEVFGRLAGELVATQRARVTFTGSAAERPFLREMAKATGAALYTGRNVGVLLGLVARSDLVISNDTGPLHFAFLLGTKAIGLYTVMSPSAWGPPVPDPSFVVLRSVLGGPTETQIEEALHSAEALLLAPRAPRGRAKLRVGQRTKRRSARG